MTKVVRDFSYWRSVAVDFGGALCILGGLGHFLDWMQKHDASSRNVAVAFLAGYMFLVLICRDRLLFIVESLAVIVAWGLFGLMTHGSWTGLVIIVPCCVVIYLLLRLRGRQISAKHKASS